VIAYMDGANLWKMFEMTKQFPRNVWWVHAFSVILQDEKRI
jgi:hypothetical protein